MKTHSAFRALSLCSACLITLISAISAVGQTNYDDFFSNNGSFEFGTPAPPFHFSGGQISTNQITGWTISLVGAFPEWLEGAEAQEGSRYLKFHWRGGLNGSSSSAHVDGAFGQTAFVLGEQYELSFWAAGGPAANNAIFLSLTMGTDQIWEDFAIPTYTQAEFNAQDLQWSEYVVSFVATAPTMSLNIYFGQYLQPDQESVVYLDNFSLTAVPEPSSMLLSAMAGLWLLLRRRNSREISAVL